VEEADLLAAAGLNPVTQWVVRTFFTRPAYFRVIADYSGTIIDGGISIPIEGESLCEVMGLE
jgi:hypothetical protein